MKTLVSKSVVGITSVLPWIFASLFAAKWLGHIASGTISYGSESSGVFLQGLCVIAFVGLTLTIVLTVMSFKWKIQPVWQVVLFIAGLLSFFSVVGD